MDSVKTRNRNVEETNLHIVNAPSQGAGQVVREIPPTSNVERSTLLQRETKDVLMHFKNNLAQLENMSSRVTHLLTEVRSVIRR